MSILKKNDIAGSINTTMEYLNNINKPLTTAELVIKPLKYWTTFINNSTIHNNKFNAIDLIKSFAAFTAENKTSPFSHIYKKSFEAGLLSKPTSAMAMAIQNSLYMSKILEKGSSLGLSINQISHLIPDLELNKWVNFYDNFNTEILENNIIPTVEDIALDDEAFSSNPPDDTSPAELESFFEQANEQIKQGIVKGTQNFMEILRAIADAIILKGYTLEQKITIITLFLTIYQIFKSEDPNNDNNFISKETRLYQKPDKRTKPIKNLYIGMNVEVGQQNKKWSHISYIDSDGKSVSGWILNESLEE